MDQLPFLLKYRMGMADAMISSERGKLQAGAKRRTGAKNLKFFADWGGI
jgi:hypothetical protein